MFRLFGRRMNRGTESRTIHRHQPPTLEPLEDRLVLTTALSSGLLAGAGGTGILGTSCIIYSRFYTLSNGVLTINGDANVVDSIELTTTSLGNLEAIFNGRTAIFGPDQVNTVVINTGAAYSGVYIFGTGTNDGVREVDVNSGGNDFVQVGNGNVLNIGTVKLTNTVGATDLLIDDAADPVPENQIGGEVLLSRTNVNFNYGATIYFGNCPLNSLRLLGGTADNIYLISDTPTIGNPALGTGGFMDLNTGSGNDLVCVSGTTGNLQIDAVAGHDVVRIGDGDEVTPLGHGSLDRIQGAIAVFNSGGATDLVVDDGYGGLSGDQPIGRVATLSDGSLTGMAAPITWQTYSGTSCGVISLDIFGNLCGNSFTILNTSNFWGGTTLNAGGGLFGANSVDILGTTGYLNLFSSAGGAGTSVDIGSSVIGSGTLANIQGTIYFTNPSGNTFLTLDDSADPYSHDVTITGAAIYGLSPSPIYTYGGVKSLTIYCGTGYDYFDLSGASTSLPITIYGPVVHPINPYPGTFYGYGQSSPTPVDTVFSAYTDSSLWSFEGNFDLELAWDLFAPASALDLAFVGSVV